MHMYAYLCLWTVRKRQSLSSGTTLCSKKGEGHMDATIPVHLLGTLGQGGDGGVEDQIIITQHT